MPVFPRGFSIPTAPLLEKRILQSPTGSARFLSGKPLLQAMPLGLLWNLEQAVLPAVVTGEGDITCYKRRNRAARSPEEMLSHQRTQCNYPKDVAFPGLQEAQGLAAGPLHSCCPCRAALGSCERLSMPGTLPALCSLQHSLPHQKPRGLRSVH